VFLFTSVFYTLFGFPHINGEESAKVAVFLRSVRSICAVAGLVPPAVFGVIFGSGLPAPDQTLQRNDAWNNNTFKRLN
jgi:hypothetical protein